MTPSQTFADFFACHELPEIHWQIDRLVIIAMVTDNGYFDSPDEREDLYFFKENLIRCLDAAYSMAGKYRIHVGVPEDSAK